VLFFDIVEDTPDISIGYGDNSWMFTDLRIPAERRKLSPSEQRILTIFSAFFVVMIILVIAEEYSTKKLSILFFFLFWGPMLVIHELGHALAAKLLGWRVHEIVIGFGRDLWRGQFGETRIKIKMAPIEGYILPAPVKPNHVRLKSTLVYAAGPGAELFVLLVMILGFGWDTVFNSSNEVELVALQSLAYVILLGAGFNLLPFQSNGALSDGLGIIASPFMPEESVELRLLTFELREIQNKIESGETSAALQMILPQLKRYPDNISLQLLYGNALSADGQPEAARIFVHDKLRTLALAEGRRRSWLHLQAQIELDAPDPNYFTLDAALQKALQITPDAPDLIATKGASFVLRGRDEDGGNLLADAWRRHQDTGNDSEMLAYLTIAAHRHGDKKAATHFSEAFFQINQSKRLEKRVMSLTRRA